MQEIGAFEAKNTLGSQQDAELNQVLQNHYPYCYPAAGVRAVLVESFERIHRSNLIGMGVLPLQYRPGESAASLGLTGRETFDIRGIEEMNSGTMPNEVVVSADGKEFRAVVRIDTPGEADYYRHGGIMQYVLRSLIAAG